MTFERQLRAESHGPPCDSAHHVLRRAASVGGRENSNGTTCLKERSLCDSKRFL